MIKAAVFSILLSAVSLTCHAQYQYNPWYFDLECDSYKTYRNNEDIVDVYKYNPETQAFEWFQNLSQYAQKIDYFMEGVGKHYVSVTDESGHTEIYKWSYDRQEFYLWG